jgi:cell division protein FtsB
MVTNNLIIYHHHSRTVNTLNNTKRKKHLRKKLVICTIGLILFCFLAIAFGRVIWLNYKLDQEIAFYSQQIEVLKIQQADILNEIMEAQDPLFIERMAREKLGLVKPGEKVVVPSKPGNLPRFIEPAEEEIQH